MAFEHYCGKSLGDQKKKKKSLTLSFSSYQTYDFLTSLSLGLLICKRRLILPTLSSKDLEHWALGDTHKCNILPVVS